MEGVWEKEIAVAELGMRKRIDRLCSITAIRWKGVQKKGVRGLLE
jgi:hypothetical protein